MESKVPTEQFLDWLRGNPRTDGWDCIVAYDRAKTNRVLRQEYIERFDSGSYLEPISGTIQTSNLTTEIIYDYILDAGRLSFENASIVYSEARLTMRIVSGAQVSLEKGPGSLVKQVARITAIDALAGPSLLMNINLLEVEGEIEDTGRVWMNLLKAFDVELTFARYEEERVAGGEYLINYFKGLDEDKQILILNELTRDRNQYISPKQFYVRTHPAPGGRDRDSAFYGSGAVYLFITTEDGDNGKTPVEDEDMTYLLPDDSSATMLLGHKFLMGKIFADGCRAIADAGSEFDYVLEGPEGDFVDQLKVLEGTRTGEEISSQAEFYNTLQVWPVFPLASDQSQMFCTFSDDRIHVEWKGHAEAKSYIETSTGANSDLPIEVSWHVIRSFGVVLDPAKGTVSVVPLDDTDLKILKVAPGANSDRLDISEKFYLVAAVLEPQLMAQLWDTLAVFGEPAKEIDVFRLNSLLFKGGDAVVIDSVHLPGDMALFGQVSPTLTEFAIEPLEAITGPGRQLPFKTVPHRDDVVWEVEAVPGSTGPTGSISADGVYTSPPLEDIEGTFTRVKVRATAGEYRQTALATVVTRDLNLNPIIQICPAGDPTGRPLSANGLNGSELKWTIADPSNGARVEPSDEEYGDHLFYPGPPAAIPGVTIEEVVVENLDTRTKQSSYVVVVHGEPALRLAYEEVGTGKVQMKAYLQGQEPVGVPIEWKILLGSGSIDADGVLTVDDKGQYKFCVIICDISFGGILFTGWLLLPMPLVNLDEALRIQRMCIGGDTSET
ncbi:hypothetical protein V0R50_09115 [Pseudomonas sp. 148P]|uniref:Ig-like domain-containing protein n=1 Tax=Pseudomonas ulcerans TaxID=3115852 RepID=A0ABU7HPC3_9PSED|nr:MULTISPECIES: hypothetical protein [unclassified Pseudomonas]MEE1920600.1 hypothetical protein [Pseudomonas sp. 147P]MEE1933382.1 hypothetical protein [Pseudomonas sp. 148P]